MTAGLRRWAPWLLLVLVLGVGLAVGARRHDGHETLGQRTLSIASQVRCPVCEGESAEQSNTADAQDIRQVIHADLARGQSSSQIIREMQAAYGVTILESPPTSGISLWVWVLPMVVVAAAIAGLALGFRHWRRQSGGAGSGGAVGSGGVAPADEALVRHALARYRQREEVATPTGASGGQGDARRVVGEGGGREPKGGPAAGSGGR